MRLYDTLTRSPVELPPPPGPIGIYWCGPTVYQRIHVGNARRSLDPAALAEALARGDRLRVDARGQRHRHQRQDLRRGRPESSRSAIGSGRDALVRGGHGSARARTSRRRADVPSRPSLIRSSIIDELVEGGFAYESEGDVYYRVSRFPDYGRLSGQRPDQVEEQEPNCAQDGSARLRIVEGEQAGRGHRRGSSPWGSGRPGWHIECSVMSAKHLGAEFEIHGGGLDLVFPHHENEIAQSRALGRRSRRSGCTTACCGSPARRCHKSARERRLA